MPHARVVAIDKSYNYFNDAQVTELLRRVIVAERYEVVQRGRAVRNNFIIATGRREV